MKLVGPVCESLLDVMPILLVQECETFREGDWPRFEGLRKSMATLEAKTLSEETTSEQTKNARHKIPVSRADCNRDGLLGVLSRVYRMVDADEGALQ